MSRRNSGVGNVICFSVLCVCIGGVFFLMLPISSLILKISRNNQNLFLKMISSYDSEVKRNLIMLITKERLKTS